MATIVVKIPNILGESTVADHADQLDAIALRDAIETPAPRGAAASASRTVSRSLHDSIEITRVRDRASPKLAQKCSEGANLGEVVVRLFRNLETGLKPYMEYTLGETIISRIDHLTLDEDGAAYEQHYGRDPGWRGHNAYPKVTPRASVYGALADEAPVTRINPSPVFPRSPARDSEGELERLWLNAARVTWKYTPYTNGVAGGVVVKGWNVQQGAPAD